MVDVVLLAGMGILSRSVTYVHNTVKAIQDEL